MAASTAAQAKTRILAALATRPALAEVRRTWAEPTNEGDFARDHIWFGETDQTEEWASLGALARAEEYTVEMVVIAYLTGDDPQGAEERGWALRAEVSAALRADKDLGGLLSQYAELQSTRMITQPASPSGWLARATLRVHCVARI